MQPGNSLGPPRKRSRQATLSDYFSSTNSVKRSGDMSRRSKNSINFDNFGSPERGVYTFKSPDAGAGHQQRRSPDGNRDETPMDVDEDFRQQGVGAAAANNSNIDPICRGTPIDHLTIFQTFSVEFLRPSHHRDNNHTMLFHWSRGLGSSGSGQPKPYASTEKDFANNDRYWCENYVRLPHSILNKVAVAPGFIASFSKDKEIVPCWPVITKALQKKIENTDDFLAAVLKYNPGYRGKWYFAVLRSVASLYTPDSWRKLLQGIASLALRLPELILQPIPTLRRQQNRVITMSQEQAACLLANAFYCTFPFRLDTRHYSHDYRDFPDINFNRLFEGVSSFAEQERKVAKLKCIINYFERVLSDMPTGTVTYERRCISDGFPDWSISSKHLSNLHVTAKGTIDEDGTGMLQMDFANKLIGGGVFGRGCVQEEIRFVVSPELLVCRLLAEQMERNECIIVTGCETFSKTQGYADTFRYVGNYQDQTQRDDLGRMCVRVVAVDALLFRKQQHDQQYVDGMVERELNKAYCAFQVGMDESGNGLCQAVATGNWGCGAFGGDVRLKSIIQLMAAAEAGRDVCYFTFGDNELCEDIASFYDDVKRSDVTVGQLWKQLAKYSDLVWGQGHGRSSHRHSTNRVEDLFTFIRNSLCNPKLQKM